MCTPDAKGDVRDCNRCYCEYSDKSGKCDSDGGSMKVEIPPLGISVTKYQCSMCGLYHS